MESPSPQFIRELMGIGILSYREHQTLWQIAKRCAATTGVTAATPMAILGTQIGSVIIPGVGSIPGTVAGALAGLVSGTISCTMLNVAAQNELKNTLQSI
ncbi:hypothetical protein [Spirosoma daeguense]